MSKASQEQAREAERQWYAGKILSLSANGALPFADEAKSVLVTELQKCGRDHAARAIERAMEGGAAMVNGRAEWTLTALREYIDMTREQRAANYNPHCEVCRGTGWKYIERGIYSGVSACPNGCQPRGFITSENTR